MLQALDGATIVLSDRLVEGQVLLTDEGRIVDLVPRGAVPAHARVRTLAGGFLAPGYIDAQVNGGGGLLFNDAPTVETIRAIGAAHRRFGTTGFLPTLISDEPDVIAEAMNAVREAIRQGVPGVLGLHLEGPVLSEAKYGIHDPSRLRRPDPALADLLSSFRDNVLLVTLAPEAAGPAFVRWLAESGVIVAAGHTAATYEQTREALAAGLRGFTHLFNAMAPLTSRAPGPIGAAFDDRHAWCSLIVDGVHVHPAALRLALHARPRGKTMLVTDAMPPVGTDARSFMIQGREMQVEDDRCSGADGTLAGSVLTMDKAVRNSMEWLGVDTPAAISLASSAPAAFLRLEHRTGRIAPGLAADLVWLDEHLAVRETWIDGISSEESVA